MELYNAIPRIAESFGLSYDGAFLLTFCFVICYLAAICFLMSLLGAVVSMFYEGIKRLVRQLRAKKKP